MRMMRAPRLGLAGLVAALLLTAPATAPAAGLPYELAFDGSTRLTATPVGGSTLAVDVTQTVAGIEFSPAATGALPFGCSTTLDVTTCPDFYVSVGLVLGAPTLETTVTGLSTPQLVLTGGADSDSMVVRGAGGIGSLAVAPGAGADTVTVSAPVSAMTLTAGDAGADRYTITSPAITGALALGDGNDVASSSLSPDLDLDGGTGDDVLSGAGQLLGGPGNDVVKPRVTTEVAAGGDGDLDRLSFEHIASGLELRKTPAKEVQVVGALPVKPGFELLEGTTHNDILSGTADPEVLLGGQGNDTIKGFGGGDVLDGGPGGDALSYETGDGVSIDLGAETGELLVPAATVDTVRSFRAVTTGAGNDRITGASGPETINAGAGDDTVRAGDGDDTIDGGPGGDTLDGGHGDDQIGGGAGADTAAYDERTKSEPVVVTLATPGGDGAAGESDTLTGVENVVGGPSNDTISGDDGANTLSGGAGLDVIDGLGGADVLFGGEDRDSLSGGSGADVLFGEGDDDSINAFDGEPDAVDCGASLDDDAQVDGADSAVGCEFARRGDVPVPVDGDGDGFVAGFDCNDASRAINPGATDVVGDGIDQNCDGFDEPVPFVDYGLSLSFSRATARGRRVSRLILRELPTGHRVQVSCKAPKRFARRCPFRRATRSPTASGNVTLTSLFRKRVLPPGTTIELRITAPGFNGRVRRFTVRAVGAVRDQRLCLLLGRTVPRACPEGED